MALGHHGWGVLAKRTSSGLKMTSAHLGHACSDDENAAATGRAAPASDTGRAVRGGHREPQEGSERGENKRACLGHGAGIRVSPDPGCGGGKAGEHLRTLCDSAWRRVVDPCRERWELGVGEEGSI